ncbi:MAG: cell division protein FtsX [Gemmatimonas sp.]
MRFRPRKAPRPQPLPFAADPGRRFVPWLIALVVFLAALALAGLMVFADTAVRWDRGLVGTLTVQVPDTGSADARGRAQQQRRVAAVVKALQGTQGVESVRALETRETAALLEPWLGAGDFVASLPLPTIVDVRLQAGARINVAGLTEMLASEVPGTTVDDHRRWTDRLVTILRAIEALAAAVVALVILAAVGMIVFATRSALAVHAETIELLHIMGATDGVIASSFARQALLLGLKGGLIGLGAAIAAGGGIAAAFARLPAGLLPKVALSPVEGVVLVLVPVAVASIAALTARRTVLSALKRML